MLRLQGNFDFAAADATVDTTSSTIRQFVDIYCNKQRSTQSQCIISCANTEQRQHTLPSTGIWEFGSEQFRRGCGWRANKGAIAVVAVAKEQHKSSSPLFIVLTLSASSSTEGGTQPTSPPGSRTPFLHSGPELLMVVKSTQWRAMILFKTRKRLWRVKDSTGDEDE